MEHKEEIWQRWAPFSSSSMNENLCSENQLQYELKVIQLTSLTKKSTLHLQDWIEFEKNLKNTMISLKILTRDSSLP